MCLNKSLGILSLLSLVLVSCRVETPNGQVPSDYLNQAKTVVGDYKGSMQGGQSGTLSVRLSGTKVVVSFSSKLLSCGGSIGTLQAIDADNSGVQAAYLGLSKASCVEGQELILSPSAGMKSFTAQVVKESHDVQTCPSDSQVMDCHSQAMHESDNCSQDSGNYSQCIQQANDDYDSCSDCSTQTEYTYITGTFVRK